MIDMRKLFSISGTKVLLVIALAFVFEPYTRRIYSDITINFFLVGFKYLFIPMLYLFKVIQYNKIFIFSSKQIIFFINYLFVLILGLLLFDVNTIKSFELYQNLSVVYCMLNVAINLIITISFFVNDPVFLGAFSVSDKEVIVYKILGCLFVILFIFSLIALMYSVFRFYNPFYD